MPCAGDRRMHSAGALLLPPELILTAVPIETKVALSHPSKPRCAFPRVPLPAFLPLPLAQEMLGGRSSAQVCLSVSTAHICTGVVLQRSPNPWEK